MSFQNAIVRARVVPSETLMLLATGDCLNTGRIGLGKEKNTISFVDLHGYPCFLNARTYARVYLLGCMS